jgi:hypothetical protein
VAKGPDLGALAAGLSSSTKTSTKAQFAWEETLANLLNIPYSANLKKFFDAWTTADQSAATNNPFNITQDYTGKSVGTLSGNTAGVLNFATALDGLQATAQFILKNTPGIVPTLASGDFQQAANQIGQTGWDGGPNAPAAVKQGYADSIFKNYTNGSYSPGNNVPTTLSPKDKAQVQVLAAQTKAQTEATSTGYLTAQEQLAAAKIQGSVDVETQKKVAEQTAHITDGTQWVQQQIQNGKVVGFAYATGPTPPKNVLEINGEPATKNDLSTYWSSGYDSIYQSFTGKVASPAVIAATVATGISQTGFQQQLAGYDPKTDTYKANPSLTSAPIYKQSGAGLVADAQKILGVAPPQTLVQQALAENWDSATFEAKVRQLPQYQSGPEFQTNLDQMQQTYEGIYGTPNAATVQNMKEYTAAGWTPTQFATYLRTQPQYKQSPEYETSVLSFMDAMGLMTGSRPVLTPGAKPITGGTTGPNSPLVPGAPTPVSTSGTQFTPKLAGAPGLT